MSVLRRVVLAILMVLLTACGGSTTPPAKDVGTVTRPTGSPLNVTVTLDATKAVKQTIPIQGGTLSVTAQDGTVYTLTIPNNALVADTEITMTPITSVTGAPVQGGKVYGVNLQPAGLRLYHPAVLSIAPPGGSDKEAIGFASQDNGKDFYLHPLALTAGLKMNLLHFSDHGVFYCCENAPLIVVNNPQTPQPIESVPGDWESELAQMMEELIRHEREAQQRNEPGDPQFDMKLSAIMNTFYKQVIQPMLGQITTDCDYAKANVAKVLSWNRQVALLGLDDDLTTQVTSVTNAVVTGMENCWKKATGPCVDPGDAVQFAEVVKVARINQLLGGDSDKYNPNDPELRCACGDLMNTAKWTGSAKYTFKQTATDGTTTVMVQRSVDFTFNILNRFDYGRYALWSGITVTGGTESVHDTYHMDQAKVSVIGSGTPSGANVSLTIYPETCTYALIFQNSIKGMHSAGIQTSTLNFVRLQDLPVPSAPVLSGSVSVPSVISPGAIPDFSHYMFAGHFSSELAKLTNNTFNELQVTWSLTPVK
ncbi:hypothetical protein [Deinococcus peraridilitoris]|uniref:ZU5 domain-containing protein n=1 Tax=Deinococcus peraridilitoris (strain DSM 19664 / LMG 22246 / CIP 109416 / KR-200) TaxID=937777 RepID=L0A7E2_DEIPD|nr:hypothetical protein [Deinococcus peraridilitoris]AFZ69731.1 hypothetical protein Deipe_4396 [Deinococcus peraridilitoris DSM 19664]